LRFAVQRPGSPEASPCSHGMPCRDVPGRVNVSVAGVSTGPACEDGLALARSRIDGPAHRTPLARVRGVDLFDPTGSLVLQSASKQSPAAGQDLSVKSSLLPDIRSRCGTRALGRASHVGDPKVLDPDDVETPRQVRGDLLTPVLPHVSLTCVQPSDGGPHLDAAPGARLAAGQSALQQDDSPLALRGQPGHGQQFPSGQSCGRGDAPVYSHDFVIAGPRNGSGDGGERDVPAASSVEGDAVGLHSIGNGTRPSEPYPSNLGHSHDTNVAGQPTDALRPKSDNPEALMTPGLAPCWSPVSPSKEVLHRLREVPQGLLLHHVAARGQPCEVGASLGQLAALCQVAGRGGTAGSPVLMLLDGEVPHEPGVCAVLPQEKLLLWSRREPVAGHKSNLLATTDILEEVMRCPSSLPNVGGSVPQSL